MEDIQEKLLSKSKEFGVEITSQQFADMMDQQDPVRELRHEFHYPKMKDLPLVDQTLVNPEEDCVYLCGNSLGLCPKGAKEIVNRQLDKWAQYGVYGHTLGEIPWAHADCCVDEQMARIVGASREEVAVMNGLTVNLHLLMLSFYEPTETRFKILLESKAFPSDHYAVESQIKLHGLDPEKCMLCLQPREGETCLRPEDILETIEKEGDQISVIMLPGVQYYTGQLFDMPAITAAGHKKGAYVGFDLAHAAGNIPLYMHDWDVDFACWCTYKYLCSGAGNIAGAFLHEKHFESKPPKLIGWWGHKPDTRFVMDNKLELISGPRGYRLTNPSGLMCASLKSALNIYDKTSLIVLREKSLLLTSYLELMIKTHFSRTSDSSKAYVDIFTPSDNQQRGCQLSLCFSIPINEIFDKLTKRGVVCDERHPSVIRIAPIHLYNSYMDAFRFIQILKNILYTEN